MAGQEASRSPCRDEPGSCPGRDAITTVRTPTRGLDAQGIATEALVHWNLTTAALVEQALERGEGLLAADGPLVVQTGAHTGRSAQDKCIVRDAAIFFGLSGTGKTTPSADARRTLIGDDDMAGRTTRSSISRAAATPG